MMSLNRIKLISKELAYLSDATIDFADRSGHILASTKSNNIGTALPYNLSNYLNPDQDFIKLSQNDVSDDAVYVTPMYCDNNFVCFSIIESTHNEYLYLITIIKSYFRIMHFEEEHKKVDHIQGRSIRSFGRDLVGELNEETLKKCLANAHLLEYPTDLPRLIITIDLLNDYLTIYDSPSSLNQQEYHEYIYYSFNSIFKRDDILFHYLNELYVLIYQIQPGDTYNVHKIYNEFKKFTVGEISMGIGSLVNKFQDYNASFNLAKHTLRYGKVLYPETNVFQWSDYKTQILILSGNPKIKKEIILTSSDIMNYFIENPSIQKTVVYFFENGMNVNKTAQKLFYHKNTILYRLNKFISDSNIDIFNAKNCADIYNLIILFQNRENLLGSDNILS